ncbi:MAG: hypothetical protein ACXWU8_09295, partial [Rhodoplanes sp.]
WVHILRISRPKVNPPRRLAILMLVALFAVSLWNPAVSQGHVDLGKATVEIGLDWFYLPLYPLADFWGRGGVWAFLGLFFLIIGLMPWLPPFRRAKSAEVDLAHCNGCALRGGLSLRGDPSGAAQRWAAVSGRGAGQSGLLRVVRNLRRLVPVLDPVPAHGGAQDRHRSA